VIPNLGSGVVYHVARKKIPHASTVDGAVSTVKPTANNGIKPTLQEDG
jgi:hypothetical protein